MRDVMLWGTAVLFLLAALFTVAVRRELYSQARDLGVLERRLLEQRRRNDNLALLRERMASPAALRQRAERNGVLEEAAR